MKFRLLSDLHLEFEARLSPSQQFEIPHLPEDKETILILAGDIHLGVEASTFIRTACEQFKFVVYVFGNHEFYHHEFHDVKNQWAFGGMPSNFVLLDNGEFIYEDVRILGATMWTDFEGSDWYAMQRAKQRMNDFRCVTKREEVGDGAARVRTFLPEDSVHEHMVTKVFFANKLAEPWDGKTVIVTHHLPHPLSVPDRFKTDILNAAYMSNLDPMIEGNEIDVWCHGHTHDSKDYEIHGTRVVCNPRGYAPNHFNPDFDPKFTFEV